MIPIYIIINLLERLQYKQLYKVKVTMLNKYLSVLTLQKNLIYVKIVSN